MGVEDRDVGFVFVFISYTVSTLCTTNHHNSTLNSGGTDHFPTKRRMLFWQKLVKILYLDPVVI